MRTKPDIVNRLEADMCLEVYPTGSRHFDDEGQVDDWYLYTPPSMNEDLTGWLERNGFNQCPDTRTREFTSYENADGVTVYICWNEQFFHKFRLATRVCKTNGTLVRSTREGSVNIFRTIFNFR